MEPSNPSPVDIEKLYPHEIKCKRIQKELSMLESEHYAGVTVGKPHQSTIGLHIPVSDGLSLGYAAAQEQEAPV